MTDKERLDWLLEKISDKDTELRLVTTKSRGSIYKHRWYENIDSREKIDQLMSGKDACVMVEQCFLCGDPIEAHPAVNIEACKNCLEWVSMSCKDPGLDRRAPENCIRCGSLKHEGLLEIMHERGKTGFTAVYECGSYCSPIYRQSELCKRYVQERKK